MRKKKLISVVLPVYNGEAFLEDSIRSILGQTYQNIELIIVNDGSTDNTSEIINRYEVQDKRIRVINNDENKKLPGSLNIGFSYAGGEYYTWSSDDNIYKETAFEEMYAFLEENTEYGLVYTDMEFINEAGSVYGRNYSRPENLFTYNCIGACFLYRSDCKITVGEYNVSKFLVEDYDYWLRISQKYKIGHIEKYLYQYRNHRKSLSATKVRQINEQVLKLKLENLDYIIQKLTDIEREILIFELNTYGYICDKSICDKILGIDYKVEEVEWIFREHSFSPNKQTVLFGSGSIGRSALEYLGEKKVYAFVDNAEEKIGTFIDGKKIISAEELRPIYHKYNVVIATDTGKAYYIAKQLDKMGIQEYMVYCQIVGG